MTLKRYEFLGFADRLASPTFRVDEWWGPDSIVDLGGRRLRVLATPGHTPTSVSLDDGARPELFAGDCIYPGRQWSDVYSAEGLASEARALWQPAPRR